MFLVELLREGNRYRGQVSETMDGGR